MKKLHLFTYLRLLLLKNHDYAVSGCTGARMPNRGDTYTSGEAYINFVAALEMVILNGKMQKNGDEKLCSTEKTGIYISNFVIREFWISE